MHLPRVISTMTEGMTSLLAHRAMNTTQEHFVLFGSADGLQTQGAKHFARHCWNVLQLCSQPDAMNFDSTFYGDALTTGDINGDEFADLIVGVSHIRSP